MAMKPLKIWEPKEEKSPEEPQHFLDMVSESGRFKIVVLDEGGDRRFVMACISPETGSIQRLRGLGDEIGLDLDEFGRVKDVTPD